MSLQFIPDVLEYCESRFRAIILAINHADELDHELLRRRLFAEVRYCMGWVGLGMSTGYAINVPVMVRYLAHAVLKNWPHVRISPEVMFILDAGNNSELPTGMVDHYESNWWNPPDFSKSMLNDQIIQDCLDFHKAQLVLATDHTHDHPPPSPTIPILPPLINLACGFCSLYRTTALNALSSIQQLRTTTQLQATIHEDYWRQSLRQASGFYTLYEGALAKESQFPDTAETSMPSTPTPGESVTTDYSAKTPPLPRQRPPRTLPPNFRKTPVTKLQDRMEKYATAETYRLAEEPSMKWTWGSNLDENDVRQLIRAGDNNYQLPHSGYDRSLKSGNIPGEMTPLPRHPDLPPTGVFSSISDNDPIPDLPPAEFPHHFHEFPLRRARAAQPSGKLPTPSIHESTSPIQDDVITSVPYFSPSVGLAALASFDSGEESEPLQYAPLVDRRHRSFSPSAAVATLDAFSSPSPIASQPPSSISSNENVSLGVLSVGAVGSRQYSPSTGLQALDDFLSDDHSGKSDQHAGLKDDRAENVEHAEQSGDDDIREYDDDGDEDRGDGDDDDDDDGDDDDDDDDGDDDGDSDDNDESESDEDDEDEDDGIPRPHELSDFSQMPGPDAYA